MDQCRLIKQGSRVREINYGQRVDRGVRGEMFVLYLRLVNVACVSIMMLIIKSFVLGMKSVVRMEKDNTVVDKK